MLTLDAIAWIVLAFPFDAFHLWSCSVEDALSSEQRSSCTSCIVAFATQQDLCLVENNSSLINPVDKFVIWLKSHWVFCINIHPAHFSCFKIKTEFPQPNWNMRIVGKIHFHAKSSTWLPNRKIFHNHKSSAFGSFFITKIHLSYQMQPSVQFCNANINILERFGSATFWNLKIENTMISHKPMKYVRLWNQWRGKWVATFVFFFLRTNNKLHC